MAVVEAVADSAVVDLADGDDVGEILFTKHNEIQLWRNSDVVRYPEPKKVRCLLRDVRGFVLGGLFARLMWKDGESQT